MVYAPTPLGKGSTRAWGLMPSSWVGFDVFRETHKQKDSTAFQVTSPSAFTGKPSSHLTSNDKGFRCKSGPVGLGVSSICLRNSRKPLIAKQIQFDCLLFDDAANWEAA